MSSNVQDGLDGGKICILGGGFAGLYTALKLAELPWKNQQQPKITIVDPKDKFVFQPLLYEYATETLDLAAVAAPYRDLVRGVAGLEVCQGRAVGVDLAAKEVEVEGKEDKLAYDKLVVALGTTPLLSTVPGADRNALTFHTLEDAYKLRQKIRALRASDRGTIKVVIVGASYSGVELAGSLVSYFGRSRARVTLINRGSDILRAAKIGNKKASEEVLSKGGVVVLNETEAMDVNEDGRVTILKKGDGEDLQELQSDLVVITSGTKVNTLALDGLTGLPKNKAGKLVVGASLKVKGSGGDVFAIGDNAVVSGMEDLPATAQVAIQQADTAAWNIRASMMGSRPIPFRFAELGEMLTLGGPDASMSSFGIDIKGPVATVARRLVYSVRQPTNSQRVKAGANLLDIRGLLKTK
eukprot:CAMPEP_0113947110 /NCGR_PEP_ID=MMETSP1339-20121228/62311_1 /TAXON_ID=94617 /ORGANISM="Fibrocapsa japonica" /LENGTH=410 /DNA_ID=CAMNT_0000953523 /DNA_START=144 /DNA_END=1376 /DNA_ORIENTATION=+ /assembly_acc=CAM_ASM_000762